MTTDYRNGVDVMTTETTCLSSIWRTDEDTRSYLAAHGREDAYKELNPADVAYYDGCVYVDLSTVKPMIALPFHPSNAYEIDELNANLKDILHGVEEEAKKIAGGRSTFTLMDKITEDGKLMVQQGIIAGCAGGTYTNVIEAANALRGQDCGCDQFLPGRVPLLPAGVRRPGEEGSHLRSDGGRRNHPHWRSAAPASEPETRPATMDFPSATLPATSPTAKAPSRATDRCPQWPPMDARSIAATAAKGGVLTPPRLSFDCWGNIPEYEFDDSSYKNRVYFGYEKAETRELIYGPQHQGLAGNEPVDRQYPVKVCSKIMDPVTTTDELIPSGETSSSRPIPWDWQNSPCPDVILSTWAEPRLWTSWRRPE